MLAVRGTASVSDVITDVLGASLSFGCVAVVTRVDGRYVFRICLLSIGFVWGLGLSALH